MTSTTKLLITIALPNCSGLPLVWLYRFVWLISSDLDPKIVLPFFLAIVLENEKSGKAQLMSLRVF
jgi:hypothetical protein